MSARETASSAEGNGIHSALACLTCKRRKVRCDRTLPVCHVCARTSQSCTYPSAPNKPGPKPGSTQRNHKRRKLSSPISSTPIKSRKDSEPSRANSSWIDPKSPDKGSEDIKRESSQLATVPPKSNHDRGSLSYIIHPSHDRATPSPPVSNTARAPPPTDAFITYPFWVTGLCQSLRINPRTYQMLLHSFFNKFRAFSLFHRPSFEEKLATLESEKHYDALMCAILSIAVRFECRATNIDVQLPSHEYLLDRATTQLQSCLDDHADSAPPLAILQGMILTLFQQLTKGVRGKAFRNLGLCIRVAYELELHLIDTDEAKTTSTPNPQLDEERRRAWWVLWEFDVFASCIRRLPTAIDWKSNKTLLPIPDGHWFSGEMCKSCFLDPDLRHRWKALQKSGNQSPTAWFIVINSLMRNAQLLRSFPGLSDSNAEQQGMQSRETSVPAGAQDENHWSIIHNTLTAIMIAMPRHMSYNEEYLSFSMISGPGYADNLIEDTAKYSIHLMCQLVRFLLYHHRCFSGPTPDKPLLTRNELDSQASPGGSSRSQSKEFSIDRQAWDHYYDAASRIVSVVRNSNRNHVLHVNPFLANTVWFAAAAHVAFRLFNFPTANHSMVESNFELLRSSFNAFANFWGVSKNLEHDLDTLEGRLQKAGQKGNGQVPNSAGANRNDGYPTAQPMAPVRQDMAYPEGELIPNLVPELFNDNYLYAWDMNRVIEYGGI